MSTERNWPVGEGGSGGCDSPRLDEAVRALREPVEVRAEWRDALLRELAAAPVPRRRPGAGALRALFGRRWSMTPAAAAAGALLCAGAGAGAAWWALRAPAPAVASGGHALGGSAVVRAASRAGGGA